LDQSVSPTVSRTATTPSVGIREDRQSVPRGRGTFLLRPRFLAAAAVVLLALAYGGREIYLRFTHVYEYDARVTADIVTVSSRADGWLMDMPVREGMQVAAGQVIARIDDRVAKLRTDALKAQIGGIQAEREKLQAERRIAEVQADTMIYTRGSAITARIKALAAVDADLALARTELERNRALFERKVVNERQMQVAAAAAAKLESQRAQAQAEYEEAEGRLLEAKAERDKLGAIDAQMAALEHQVTNLEAQLAQQRVDVEDRTIRSPVSAVIDRTFVLPGEYLAAGQRILLLHNPKEVWVEANIKETQVGRLKLGQHVVVAVDAYPDDRFMGRVARIGSATTARFALIPTPNPSGNFTKITQRVPVKIDMVEMPRALSPGMMVEVEIDLR
jgi:membrane fusion protein (multidrug efflux system)